jgi:pilus assembly protein CpaF
MTTTEFELELSIMCDDQPPQALSLPGGQPLWLGRDPACDVVLAGSTVSRRHVSLQAEERGVRVRDASNNGTQVGDTLLRGAERLVTGQAQLRIGDYVVLAERRRHGALTALGPSALVAQRPAPKFARAADVPVECRKLVQRRLLDYLDLSRERENLPFDAHALRPKVLITLRQICGELEHLVPRGEQREQLIKELCDECLGLGPLEDLLHDPEVSEIMVVEPHTIYAEIRGKLELTPYRFTDADSVRAALERIVTPLGRRIDESSPMVDARLPDGSRVNAVIPPLALKGPCITIRKFPTQRLSLAALVTSGSLNERMARFLSRAVKAKKSIVIAGGTGSGKTTLLNVLSTEIPERERIVTIEDAAELSLSQRHVVALESRPPNMEGKGAYSIRDLVRNALRMRPDRIIVGECRGGEAIDMLQAMNTGHEGSLTTTHANSPEEALSRLETLCLMSGLDLPVRAIRMQIMKSVDLLVQQTRYADGTRRVSSISEVCELSETGELACREIFSFQRAGTGPSGEVLGDYCQSGYVPSFIEEFATLGLVQGEDFL